MLQLISTILTFLAISPQIHIVSFAFCPFIFGGFAIVGIIKWVKLEQGKTREMWWSISTIILMILVLVFVGLNTFLWLNETLFYVFMPVRFTLLLFFAVIANPYIKWSPLKGIFTTKTEDVVETNN